MFKSRWLGPLCSLLACSAIAVLITGCPPGTPGTGNGNGVANANVNRNAANANGNANVNGTANGNGNVNQNANGGCPTGTAAAGMTLFTMGRANITTCTTCHNANGVGGPVATNADVRNFTTCTAVQTRMMEVSAHSGFVANITTQDFADLAAFFDSLTP
ncbi:MAG TPA: hypothetical protein VGM03_22745 [Phycisphaerae bacterium]